MIVTIVIIIITAAVSVLCFAGAGHGRALRFSAYGVWHRGEWWCMVSYGLVHGGWWHLIFNMVALYFFGPVVEGYFLEKMGF